MDTGAREINARAEVYLEMETLVIVRESNYWGAGKAQQVHDAFLAAGRNYKKSCGKFPSGAAVVSTFEGKPSDLDRITVDDIDGTISYPKTVIKQ